MRAAVGLIVAALALTVPGVAQADPLVVDGSSTGGGCSDSRPASEVRVDAPWCTITRAVTAAPSGSTVYVRGGSYPYQKLHALGSRSDYVTLEPYGYEGGHPESVTIAGISTANTSFLRIRGFHLAGSDTRGLVPAARLYLQSSHIQLIGNDMTGEGVYLQGADDVLIARNRIHALRRNCRIKQIGDGGGIFVQRSADVRIVRNRVEGAWQDALNVGAIPDLVVRRNDLSNAHGRLCGDHTDLVQIEGGRKGPMTFTRNVFRDGGQFVLRNATGLTLARNLILRVNGWMTLVATPGARVVRNTWWGGNATCAACGSLLLRDYGPADNFARPPFDYVNHMDGTVVEGNVMRRLARDGVPLSAYREDRDVIYGPRAANSGVQGAHTRLIGPGQRAIALQQTRQLARLGALVAPAHARADIAAGVRIAAVSLW